MKVPFEKETTYAPEWRGNLELPEAERVLVTISWPSVLEGSVLPELEFEEVPAPTGKEPERKVSRATNESLSEFADAVLRQRIPRIEHLDGISSGSQLADAPEENFAGLIWDIILKYRAGPGALIEKKKD